MTFEDYSTAKKNLDPDAQDSDLKVAFDAADTISSDGSLSYDEYKILLENE